MEENAVLRKESPTDKPPREPWSRKTKIIVWSVVGAILIVAIVLGIVFGVRANQYKMRAFKKDGVTYEQYNVEMASDSLIYFRTPRGEQVFYPDYIQNTSLVDLIKNNKINQINDYTAFTSNSLKDNKAKDKRYKSYYHMILYENDHKWHYYDHPLQEKHRKDINDKKAKKIWAKNKNVIFEKKNTNPIITGWVDFQPGLLLYVDNGIVTRLQLDGEFYTFS